MAKYIDGEWVMDNPLPREPYFKVGDVLTVHQQQMTVTEIRRCASYGGPVGSLKDIDTHLKDEDFHFICYHVHFDKWESHDRVFYLPDDRLKKWLDGTNTNWEVYGNARTLFDENPPKPEKPKKKEYVPDPLWDYVDSDNAEGEAIHYPIYIERPSKINLTRKEFHKLSFFGIAALFVSYRYFFEECAGGIQIYMSEGLGYEYAFNKRFDGLEKYKNSQCEFVYIRVPKDHQLYDVIHKRFNDLIIF